MKPDQERLSEQESGLTIEGRAAVIKAYLSTSTGHPRQHVDWLARQLTEAERRIAELESQPSYGPQGRWTELRKKADRAERYREALEYIAGIGIGRLSAIARQALDTGDGQPVAPQSTPKSGSGEEAGGE